MQYQLLEKTGIDVSQFKFEPSIFLYKDTVMLYSVIAYLLGIYGLQRWMTHREKWTLKYPIALHNGFLSIASLGLLVLFVENLFVNLFGRGFHYALCAKELLTPEYVFFCYANYLLKYYELLDTVFLCLKKKEVPFLHIYHHAMTLLLTHVQLSGRVAVQWIPITINLFVHVFMYFYYMLATFEISVWWKKYLTSLQIIQFVIDIVFCVTAFTFKIVDPANCTGDTYYAVFGIGLLSSYLLLFLDFFTQTYSPKRTTTNNSNDKKNVPNNKTSTNNKANTKADIQKKKK